MTADAGGVGAPRFDVVLRGYDRRQVDEHVARLQRVVSRMRADLEMVRSQPIPVVQAPPPGFGGPGPGQGPGRPVRPTPRPRPDEPDMIGSFTDRMQSILQAAEEEAAEIRNKARAGARAESESVRAELADIVRQRDAVLVELKRLRGQLEGMLGAPTARMAVAPRDGGASGRPAQSAASGASKPGQPSGPERSAPAGGPPKPRPAPSPTGPPKGPGQQSGVPQPASAQASPPRPGAPAQQSSAQQSSAQQQPTQQSPVASRPASAQQSSGPTLSKAPPSKSSQPGASQVAGQQPPAGQPNTQSSNTPSPNTQTPNAKNAPTTGGAVGQNGAPPKTQNGAAPQNGAARTPAAGPAPSGPRPVDARPPASDAAKAAHRLPTGAYPAVAGEQPSMRPRSEPEPEPGDLFRPSAQQGRDAKPAARKPGDVEATVKVGLVRPVAAQSDRTVLSPTVAPAEKKEAAKDAQSDKKRPDGDGSTGPGHPDRSSSTSRSG